MDINNRRLPPDFHRLSPVAHAVADQLAYLIRPGDTRMKSPEDYANQALFLFWRSADGTDLRNPRAWFATAIRRLMLSDSRKKNGLSLRSPELLSTFVLPQPCSTPRDFINYPLFADDASSRFARLMVAWNATPNSDCGKWLCEEFGISASAKRKHIVRLRQRYSRSGPSAPPVPSTLDWARTSELWACLRDDSMPSATEVRAIRRFFRCTALDIECIQYGIFAFDNMACDPGDRAARAISALINLELPVWIAAATRAWTLLHWLSGIQCLALAVLGCGHAVGEYRISPANANRFTDYAKDSLTLMTYISAHTVFDHDLPCAWQMMAIACAEDAEELLSAPGNQHLPAF